MISLAYNGSLGYFLITESDVINFLAFQYLLSLLDVKAVVIVKFAMAPFNNRQL